MTICLYRHTPNYRKEFAVFGHSSCNQNKEKHRKNTRRFNVNSSSIRQYTFCLEIQSINRGNRAFFDPYSAHTAIYYRKQGFYIYCDIDTVLYYRISQLLSCNSPLVNQKLVFLAHLSRRLK